MDGRRIHFSALLKWRSAEHWRAKAHADAHVQTTTQQHRPAGGISILAGNDDFMQNNIAMVLQQHQHCLKISPLRLTDFSF